MIDNARQGWNNSQARQRRRGSLQKLRKMKRDSAFLAQMEANTLCTDATEELETLEASEEAILDLKCHLNASDAAARSRALRRLHRMLSARPASDTGPLGWVAKLGVVPLLADVLSQADPAALCVLGSLAASTHAHAVAVIPAVPALIAQLHGPDSRTVGHVLCTLANVSLEDAAAKATIVTHGAAHKALQLIEAAESLETRSGCAWALSCFCKAPLSSEALALSSSIAQAVTGLVAELALDTTASVARTVEGMLVEVLGALTTIVETDGRALTGAEGLAPRLLAAAATRPALTAACFRLFGTIIADGPPAVVAELGRGGLLDLAQTVLAAKPTDTVACEVCWTVSSLMLGPPDQVMAVLGHSLFEFIISWAPRASHAVQYEICYILLNLINNGRSSDALQMAVYDMAVIDTVAEILTQVVESDRLSLLAMKTLDKLLAHQPPTGDWAAMAEAAGVRDVLGRLTFSSNLRVYEQAIMLLDEYFPADSDLTSDGW
ncbi:hypothetical protein J8273_0465 [Carpediemonas membranifera]|uniref:IBB domain-containing protein n=1 Tax=Carpediemonas membranifera TaxID=201153 RepID=A0A8J6EAS5_9EUKA|nr:hypothetical protein J8273_0465 [Carpediemonas membranifera]|eukprot:KAG9395245.1 hypothetical protein J8273_0465 [Carpediemonas membranifera]